ncbi:MAG TPA: adenylate/guanylate cyclase domain-containing protein [Saprospiraceae bacterium]|nr:adenylate/guanylate cyclase domain-containing protein [Saprospiraceae bacterium]
MKYLTAFLLLFAFAGPFRIAAQSVSELENKFNRSGSKSERMNLAYQIAEKTIASSPKKASDFANRSSQLATEIGDKRREADAAFLSADAEYRLRNYKEATNRFMHSWQAARNYGLRDVALSSTEKLQDIALKQNDYREALKWSRETVNYLKDSGGGLRGGGDAQRRLENQLAAAEANNRALREQLASATGQTQVLETTYQSQLKEVQEKSQQELSQKEQTISQIEQARQRSDSLVSTKSRMVETLTKEQMADAIVRGQQEKDLQLQKTLVAEAELGKQQSENVRNVLAMVAAFVLVLALLFYFRFRAKRRTANELTEKNALIEAEQKRSENLLLNILPPAIAQELKTRSKVAARKYDQATVMFVDFTGFTKVAEQLSPEMLVEELDYCFSNFDRIIGQYRIEKIKTIGDAYLCASGLSDMNASPSDIIRAALEIQDFLLGLKAERLDRGMPFFEARVGIHIGPVVAGVVGAKKFAYDIWGDTVNVAARFEEACEPGRVNVSESVYDFARYEFEWNHRGKIAAKNKGLMDMYYVTAVKTY